MEVLKMNDLYKGYRELTLSNEEMANFYNQKLSIEDLMPNEFLIIKNENGEAVDFYKNSENGLVKVSHLNISSRTTGLIKPRNDGQKLAINLLQNDNIGIKMLRGVYGSGKDYLMLNQALAYLEKEKFKKIVFIRPNVSVKDVPDIGYLKGDAFEKLAWTLGPFYDKVGGEEGVRMMIERGTLELVPLPFIRGRSFENSIVYVCEGQNITTEIAKLIISRLGDGSELWINADTHQTDNKIYEKDNGIIKMIDRLKDENLFGMIYLDKTERSAIANLANKLDD